ncbi:MAG: hypothetical protein WD048_07815 [Chitinophagales bacterium]
MQEIDKQLTKHPVLLGVCITALSLFLIVLSNFIPFANEWAWKIASTALLFYAVTSVIFSIKQKKFRKYIFKTLLSFLSMLLLLGSASWLISDNASEHLKYYKTIYFCQFVFFLLIIGLAILFRGMLKFVSGDEPHKFF